MNKDDIQQITERISQKIELKGVTPDKTEITDKLTSYINDFGVVAYEAERKILSDQMKKHGFSMDEVSVKSSNTEDVITHIADLQPNEWVTVEAKVVSLQPSISPSIAQSGVIADCSGAIKFVTFAKSNNIPTLEQDHWYKIELAVVDSYRTALNLKINSNSKITPITEDRTLTLPASTTINQLASGILPLIHVKFIEEWQSRSDKVLQTGIIADSSGKMKFTIWNDSKLREKLVLGSTYDIYYSTIDTYADRQSLTLNSGIWKLNEDINLDVPITATMPTSPLPITQISNLSVGYASLRVKFIDEWDIRSDKMLQTGLIGDETGRIKFVIWKDDKNKKDKLELNRVYNITNAKINEYNGVLSVILNNAEYSPEDINVDIEVGSVMNEYTGSIVQIANGSGLIKRCPVEGCNRVLLHQNICPVHEIQNDFKYDLRIKAILDNGQKVYNLLFGRGVTESITGITMDQAIELSSNSPLGLEEIQMMFADKLCGRYIRGVGTDYGDQVILNSVEFMQYDSQIMVDLLNRAGGEKNV